MPHALQLKYPSANKSLNWQYLFPSAKLSIDPESQKLRAIISMKNKYSEILLLRPVKLV
jgi:hypothetical protein